MFKIDKISEQKELLNEFIRITNDQKFLQKSHLIKMYVWGSLVLPTLYSLAYILTHPANYNTVFYFAFSLVAIMCNVGLWVSHKFLLTDPIKKHLEINHQIIVRGRFWRGHEIDQRLQKDFEYFLFSRGYDNLLKLSQLQEALKDEIGIINRIGPIKFTLIGMAFAPFVFFIGLLKESVPGFSIKLSHEAIVVIIFILFYTTFFFLLFGIPSFSKKTKWEEMLQSVDCLMLKITNGSILPGRRISFTKPTKL